MEYVKILLTKKNWQGHSFFRKFAHPDDSGS